MERFSADKFFMVGQLLGKVDVLFHQMPRDTKTDPGALRAGDNEIGKFIESVLGDCRKLGLTISVKCTEHVLETDRLGTTSGKLGELIEELARIIRWEMEDKLFMHVPTERAAYYEKPELFGKEVGKKFPSIQFDLEESGNCYAAGRGTAAVFHLMRIMETGVQNFGSKLGISLTQEKNWQNILDEVNKAIKKLPPKDASTVTMSQVSANLYSVKLAWRNEVMHPKETYTLDEAKNLIQQVHIFMENLATVV